MIFRRSFAHSLLVLVLAGSAIAAEERFTLWLDVYEGEPLRYQEMVADLATARVVYLGERHTLVRHHQIQADILRDLAKAGKKLVLALEQMEARQQPLLEQFNAGKLDFPQLAKATEWAKRWNNYEQYRPVLETAQAHKIPVLALNAPTEVIRQVARGGGLAKLAPEVRKQLPPELVLTDPEYERLLNLQMAVHMAATPERMRPMIEAQLARDETMAHVLAEYLRQAVNRNRQAIVLCGSGHAAYGLAMVSRVRRRLPDIVDRIVLLSGSGDVELSEAERAAARDIEITHEQMRFLARPIADYLQVRSLRPPPKDTPR